MRVFTWSMVFLIGSCVAALLGLIVRGPMGPVLFFVFLALCIAAIVAHYVHEHRPPAIPLTS